MIALRAISMTATAAVVLCPMAVTAATVKEKNNWSETYKVVSKSPQLEVSNIWGDVRVRPGKSNEIVVSVREVRSAPSKRLFDRSFESISLQTEASDNGVSLKVGDPQKRWNKMNSCQGCRVEYQFDIQVPANSTIDVSTVNDGKIDVQGITGLVSAGNVNGPLSIADIRNCDQINTVNGRIDVSYSEAPTSDCDFQTINGDVTLSVPLGSALDVSVDLFNGKVSSELDIEPFALPAKVERTDKDGRKKYVIKKKSGFRIGSDGPVYTIASMNGDVRIKEKQ